MSETQDSITQDQTDEFSFVLKPSSIPNAGVGVFALHGIKAGTKLMINKEGGESRVMDINDIPEPLRHFGIALPELPEGKRKVPKEFNHLWFVWFLNHSDNPNAELREKDNAYYSTKDIQADEEILIDYNAFREPDEVKADYYK